MTLYNCSHSLVLPFDLRVLIYGFSHPCFLSIYSYILSIGLDALHSVILRQKSMAQQIGSEIHQQNEIIDEIGRTGFILFYPNHF